MHLIVPFAAPLSEVGRQALSTLKLAQLDALLARLGVTARDEGDEYALSPPHERALARALGLAGGDGRLPWAAWLAGRDGIDTQGDLAWGLLTPVNWQVASDHILLTDPAALALDADESRAFLSLLRELFEAEGFAVLWGAPERWYVVHESLREQATASLDRVIGRSVDPWLPPGPQARRLRRLQNEVQMLLYEHPLNEAREARGQLPLNSFWLSGCGLRQPVADTPPWVDERLREPALNEDWGGWIAAWQALDAGPVAAALAALRRGEAVTLDLCGERGAVQLASRAPSIWQRLRRALRATPALPLLQTL
jgi:hypothetical protein